MNIITGEQAEKLFVEFMRYKKYKDHFCSCGVRLCYMDNVVAAVEEKNINGADVETLEFFCSRQCAHEWLDNIESKKETA